MAKTLKRLLALGVAAMLLFACAACNGGKPPEPTDPEISEESTTEPETIDVVVTEDEETTAEEDATEDETTTEAEATTGVPKDKAEIVAYFNEAMAKVKADKPGYTFQERTHIDDTKISSSNRLLNTIAPPIVRAAKGAFSKWTDPSVKAKGADHSGLPPYAEVNPSWIKSATCTESGGNYIIRLNLVNENVPKLPHDNKTTIHGKVLDRGVFNWDAVMGGVEEIGMVDINEFACAYSGSYVEAVFNKTTGAAVKITTWTACQADVVAKVGFTLDASVPLANESTYVF